MTKLTYLFSNLILTVFLLSNVNTEKLVMVDPYDDLFFISLDGSGEIVNFLDDDSKFTMKRTEIIGDAYYQVVYYIPESLGLIYHYDTDEQQFYYDLVGPNFPFYFYFNEQDMEDLEDEIDYAEFINDTNFQLSIESLDQINEYYKSFDFPDDSQDDYEENGKGAEFHHFESDTEPDLDLDKITLRVADPNWLVMNPKVKNINIEYLTPEQYGMFYKNTLLAIVDSVDATIKSKLSKYNLGTAAWDKVYQTIISSLESVYSQVNAICSEIAEEDPLEQEKSDLAKLLGSDAVQTYQVELNAFNSLMDSPLPLGAALYYKAKYNIFFSGSARTADDIVESFNERMVTENWYKEFFMGSVSLMNFELLSSIFQHTNNDWINSSVGNYLNNIDWDLKKLIRDPVDNYLRNATGFDNEVDVLDGFDVERNTMHLLSSSHPYFVRFYMKFSENIDPEMLSFYEKNYSSMIKNYKKETDGTYNGKGSKAFVSQFYRVSLEVEDPEDASFTESYVNSNDFFEYVEEEEEMRII